MEGEGVIMPKLLIIGYPKNNDNGTKYGQFYLKTKIRYHSVDFQ